MVLILASAHPSVREQFAERFLEPPARVEGEPEDLPDDRRPRREALRRLRRLHRLGGVVVAQHLDRTTEGILRVLRSARARGSPNVGDERVGPSAGTPRRGAAT